ncbi:hypothetical protein TIFTF001_046223 [Ficus carica]|uniref:NB-ARC domain-containing protein n=1 Tax=Ficus carica TaxID=3494 RepID=A0AA88D671_FICCA|nr:hypothetical protein TIFTF001_046223 [Ficus carica]
MRRRRMMACISCSQNAIDIPNKGYETFGSRVPTLSGIMEALRDPNIRTVGMYGPSGVGKTMLVKEVGRRAKEAKLFDSIVLLFVSRTPILEKLRLKVTRPYPFVGTSKPKTDNILIILNDLWESLDLEDIGSASDKKGYKLLLTSRFQEVICNDMSLEKCFLLDAFPDNEATNLFTKKIRGSIQDSDLQPLAT